MLKNIFFLLLSVSIISCSGENAETANSATKAKPATAKPSKTEANIPVIKKQQKPTRQAPAAMALADYKAKNDGWLVSLEAAQAESKKTGKPILANFTGSDWCGWCKRLDKSVFHQQDFAKWAKKNVVLLELDFPRKFRVPNEIAMQNNTLKQKLGIRGFPTIYLFDIKDVNGKADIQPLGRTGYAKTVAEFTGNLDKFLAARKS